jgi:hypothetical protein
MHLEDTMHLTPLLSVITDPIAHKIFQNLPPISSLDNLFSRCAVDGFLGPVEEV